MAAAERCGELGLEAAFASLCDRHLGDRRPATETIAAGAALGRILAQDLVAPIDLPGEDVSAMDGYALRCADLGAASTRLHVVALALAGKAQRRELAAGTCVRVMTGAPMPSGADAVALLEDVRAADGAIVVDSPLQPGRNRRRRGEHVQAGTVVLTAGRRLRAPDLALAAAIGCAQLAVGCAPRVGVLSTGDELFDAGTRPAADLPYGGAFDSNRPLFCAALAREPMAVTDLGICPDDPAALARTLDAATAQGLDVLLVSGGTARGDADLVRALPGAYFLPLAVRPGRGLLVAELAGDRGRLLVLGLPGNAVAAYGVFHLLVLPLLRALGGGRRGLPQALHLALAHEARARAGRIDLRRGRWVSGPAGAASRVELLREQGSAMLRTVCAADCLVALGPKVDYAAGEPVAVYPIERIEP